MLTSERSRPVKAGVGATTTSRVTATARENGNGVVRKDGGASVDGARSSPTKKRKLDVARSTPNLKVKREAEGEVRVVGTAVRNGVAVKVEGRVGSEAQGVVKARSPQRRRLESSDESSDDESGDDRGSKRSKQGSTPPRGGMGVDKNRKMVHPLSFHKRDPKTGLPVEQCVFVHAEEIAGVSVEGYSRRPGVFLSPKLPHRTISNQLATEFKNSDNSLIPVGLHYPGIGPQEKFQLVSHSDPDEFDPITEILDTMSLLSTSLLPTHLQSQIFSELGAGGGTHYRIKRALRNHEPQKLVDAVRDYNALVRQCRKDGTFKKRISTLNPLPSPLVEHILTQSYARTVALRVEELKDYQAFSNEVYGELLPKFTSKIFKETHLDSTKIFVDLGSGTGNVVLHAALATGAAAYGCEKMPTPATLAAAQLNEFKARCRMWGLNHGPVELYHASFLDNPDIARILPKADVLLVNNFAFEPDLNQKLLDMFLDLKEGAVVVSLKPFVPSNHVISKRNVESPVNRLKVEVKEYWSGEVSWTDAGGKWYVNTVDGAMVREFWEREKREGRGKE